jgi:hypothetical protein
MIEWLSSAEMMHENGHTRSWWNPEHPGYAYPEISGLLLTLLELAQVAPRRRRSLAVALRTHPDCRTGVGRFGTSYTFDIGMALRALMRHEPNAALDGPDHQLAEVLLERIERRQATDGDVDLAPDTRWSLSFGAHQAKVAGAVVESHRLGAFGGRPWDALLQLRDDVMPLQADDGRFVVHARSTLTYLHSHCYALEGLLMMADAGVDRVKEPIEEGAKFLARVQQNDGSVRAWHDGAAASGPCRGDATAQLVRILAVVDAGQYAEEIEAGRNFLVRELQDGRSVPYEPGSRDLSSWATIFAAQALAAPDHLVAPTSGATLV